jgi:hypothetical protein
MSQLSQNAAPIPGKKTMLPSSSKKIILFYAKEDEAWRIHPESCLCQHVWLDDNG